MRWVPSWVVVVLHLGFGVGETVDWHRMGERVMAFSPEQIELTRMMALNQGAYNAGVALILAWALATKRVPTTLACLIFVVAMAVVGAISVKASIFVVQGVPAMVAIGALLVRNEPSA